MYTLYTIASHPNIIEFLRLDRIKSVSLSVVLFLLHARPLWLSHHHLVCILLGTYHLLCWHAFIPLKAFPTISPCISRATIELLSSAYVSFIGTTSLAFIMTCLQASPTEHSHVLGFPVLYCLTTLKSPLCCLPHKCRLLIYIICELFFSLPMSYGCLCRISHSPRRIFSYL